MKGAPLKGLPLLMSDSLYLLVTSSHSSFRSRRNKEGEQVSIPELTKYAFL